MHAGHCLLAHAERKTSERTDERILRPTMCRVARKINPAISGACGLPNIRVEIGLRLIDRILLALPIVLCMEGKRGKGRSMLN